MDEVTKRRGGKKSKLWYLTHPNPKSSPKEIAGSHGHKPHGPSILWPALYEHLRKKGMSKAKAAAISNAGWKKKKMGIPTNTPMSAIGLLKADPVDQSVISKLDDEKQNVFGWAYVTHDHHGELNVDKSGEFVDDPAELEDAVYDFVLHTRRGGADHVRTDNGPVVRSTLVESLVVTDEKLAAMGLSKGDLPTGWWVGFHVHDPDIWQGVKDGRYKAFSVHGTGIKEDVLAKGSGPTSAQVHPTQLLRINLRHMAAKRSKSMRKRKKARTAVKRRIRGV